MQPPQPITSEKSPRDTFAANFDSCEELPIRGGWGYSQEDACIIDKDDPIVDPSLPFNGVGVEYDFVEKRIFEEMVNSRPEGEKFSEIEWTLLVQNLSFQGDRVFDRLLFEITAYRQSDWDEFEAEYVEPLGLGHPDPDVVSHNMKLHMKLLEKMVRFNREFWFDITSFFGQ